MPSKPISITKFGSLITSTAPESVPPGYLTRARNVRINSDEVMMKPGATLALSDPYSLIVDITGIGSFKDARGGNVLLVMDSASNIFALNPYPGEPVGSTINTDLGAASVIAAGNILKLEAPAFPITANSYMDVAAAYNRAFMCFSRNQTDTSDGNGIRQLYYSLALSKFRYSGMGLASAVNEATYASSATAGDIRSGTRYAIVIYETETGYQSGYSIAAITRIDVASGGFKIDLSSIPIHPIENVTKRIIAFTQAGASSDGPYFYIPDDDFLEGLTAAVDGNGNNITKTVIEDNTTTIATFNFPDEYLLGSTEVTSFLDKIEFSPPDPKSVFYSKTQRRLITCGEDDHTFRLSEVDDPETFMATTGLLRPGEGDGGIAMCAREFRRELYLLKNNGGFLAHGTALPPAQWHAPQMWEGVGPEGPWAADTCDEFMAIAHRSGPYIYTGNAPEWIGQEIGQNKEASPNWELINWDYRHLIYTTIDIKNKLVRFGVPMGDSTKVNVELIVDYSEGWKRRKWSWDNAAFTRTIVGRRPGGSSAEIFMASNALDGKILAEDDDAISMDGGKIEQVFRTAYVPEENADGVYQLNLIEIKASGAGNMGLKVFTGENAAPTERIIPMSASVRTVSLGVVGAQGEQFSVEISNNSEVGAFFRILAIKLHALPIWGPRSP